MTVLEENSPSNPSQWPDYATAALSKVIVILFIKLIIIHKFYTTKTSNLAIIASESLTLYIGYVADHNGEA